MCLPGEAVNEQVFVAIDKLVVLRFECAFFVVPTRLNPGHGFPFSPPETFGSFVVAVYGDCFRLTPLHLGKVFPLLPQLCFAEGVVFFLNLTSSFLTGSLHLSGLKPEP